MTAEAPRRAFLRGLLTLPLVGGAVELLGNPRAVAMAPTRELQLRYIAWLANEHAAALIEYQNPGIRYIEPEPWRYYRCHSDAPLHWFPDAPDIEAAVWLTRPSSRAALVLSAVGCECRSDWPARGERMGRMIRDDMQRLRG